MKTPIARVSRRRCSNVDKFSATAAGVLSTGVDAAATVVDDDADDDDALAFFCVGFGEVACFDITACVSGG